MPLVPLRRVEASQLIDRFKSRTSTSRGREIIARSLGRGRRRVVNNIIFCESTTYISGDYLQTCANINLHEVKNFEENRYSAKAINV